MRTTGSQKRPANTYSAREMTIQPSVSGQPLASASQKPVTGCNITAVAVNHDGSSDMSDKRGLAGAVRH